MRKVILAVNPVSGRARHGLVRARCVEALNSAGLEVDVLDIPGPGEAARVIGEYGGADFDALLAGGGDGTVREVAEVAARLEIPLGIVPLGTSNSVARDLGLPLDPVKAAALIPSAGERSIDMADAGGAKFLLCMSAGLDAEVVRRVHSGRSGGIRKLSYVGATLGSFFGYSYPPLEVVVDGVPMPEGAIGVVVANARVYAGYFELASEAEIDDGLLDVCLFYGGKWSLVRQAVRAWRGRPLRARPERHSGSGAIVLQAREVFIPGPPSAPVQIDGDVAAGLPRTIKVLHRSLRVLVPGSK
ncbi:MAG: diacylglycerol/lipid kinase family protein [Planctomycetota bacterium]